MGLCVNQLFIVYDYLYVCEVVDYLNTCGWVENVVLGHWFIAIVMLWSIAGHGNSVVGHGVMTIMLGAWCHDTNAVLWHWFVESMSWLGIGSW